MNMPNLLDEDVMPTRHKAMTRVAIMSTLPDGRRYKDHKPSPAQMIEARKANAAAARDPLSYCFGEPLPGRSALDKLKKGMR